MDDEVISKGSEGWKLLYSSFTKLCRWKQGKVDVKFPQPRSISRNDLHNLRTNMDNYYVSDKSDGERFMMMFVQSGVYMVSRSLTFSRVRYTKCLPNLLAGTVLDGEFSNSKYIVFDCVAITGTYVGGYELSRRLYHARCVNRMCTLEKCEMVCKSMVRLCFFWEFVKSLQSLPYKYDGVIFTPSNKPIVFGTCDTYKWKDGSMNTVDFTISEPKERNVYDLSCIRNQELEVFTKVRLDESIVKTIIDVECPVICEMRFDRKADKWCLCETEQGMPVLRKDKTTPNHWVVVQRTIQNIQENITMDQLQHAFRAY